jgi:error-prone DNA polymerase
MQREGEVVHIIVKRCFNLSKMLRGLNMAENDNQPVLTLSRADETSTPYPVEPRVIPSYQVIRKDIFPKGRNFK